MRGRSGGPRAYAAKPYNQGRALTMIRAIGIEGLVAAMSKVAGMRETITTGVRLEYLPPYSPELSPMALARAKLKSRLRVRAARTREALEEAWTEVLTCKNRDLTQQTVSDELQLNLAFCCTALALQLLTSSLFAYALLHCQCRRAMGRSEPEATSSDMSGTSSTEFYDSR